VIGLVREERSGDGSGNVRTYSYTADVFLAIDQVVPIN
jgi:hypothetical protein